MPGVSRCGMESGAEIIGLYFFEETVTAESYLKMLDEWLWPQIARAWEEEKLHFLQQDGAAPRYAATVREWLNEHLPEQRIGRRGAIEWPARSPDLTPPDFFFMESTERQSLRRETK